MPKQGLTSVNLRVRGLIARGGQAFLIFKAAWRQQDEVALAGGACHGSDLIGTLELVCR
jgi:hypothetical protein